MLVNNFLRFSGCWSSALQSLYGWVSLMIQLLVCLFGLSVGVSHEGQLVCDIKLEEHLRQLLPSCHLVVSYSEVDIAIDIISIITTCTLLLLLLLAATSSPV